MAMTIYRLLQIGTFLFILAASINGNGMNSGGIELGVIAGGICTFVVTMILNFVWGVLGLWPREDA